MGEIRVNLTNFVTVGIMAYLFYFVATRGYSFVKSKMGA